MAATTIKQTEALPEAYPSVSLSGLSAAAAALADAAWQRIEAYTAYRWSERDVEWIVEGCGAWQPPLTPATITTVEIWRADAWEAVTLSPSPLGGYCLPGGTFRFTGTAGGGVVPPAGEEAFRRLAEYMAADPGTPGATSERTDIPGVMSEETSRAATWMARAMANSGAGDLLRPYRRA